MRAPAGKADLPGGSGVGGETGFTLPELLVSLFLSVLLVFLGGEALVRQLTVAKNLRVRAEAVQTARLVRGVVLEELRGGALPRDAKVWEGDSLALRVFRGVGIPCPEPGEGDGLRVTYRGLRAPDPGKDSVLVLESGGRWRSADLRDRIREEVGCPGREDRPVERWIVEPAPDAPALLRFFESGSYHLADEAFRYRRGAGGRQPLSGPSLDPGGTGFLPGGGGEVRVRLRLRLPWEPDSSGVGDLHLVHWPRR